LLEHRLKPALLTAISPAGSFVAGWLSSKVPGVLPCWTRSQHSELRQTVTQHLTARAPKKKDKKGTTHHPQVQFRHYLLPQCMPRSFAPRGLPAVSRKTPLKIRKYSCYCIFPQGWCAGISSPEERGPLPQHCRAPTCPAVAPSQPIQTTCHEHGNHLGFFKLARIIIFLLQLLPQVWYKPSAKGV